MNIQAAALPTEAEMEAKLAKLLDDDVEQYLIRNNFARMSYGNTAKAGADLHKRFTPDERVQFLACHEEWCKTYYDGPLMNPVNETESLAEKTKTPLGPHAEDDNLLHTLVIDYLSARNESYILVDPVGAICTTFEALSKSKAAEFMEGFKAA